MYGHSVVEEEDPEHETELHGGEHGGVVFSCFEFAATEGHLYLAGGYDITFLQHFVELCLLFLCFAVKDIPNDSYFHALYLLAALLP